MAQPYVIIPAQGSDEADEWHRLGFEAQMASNSLIGPARDAKLGEAQQRYGHALRLDPRHAMATHNLAVVFAQAGHLNEALLTIERAYMMDGDHSCIKATWSLMALEAENIDVALKQARAAVEQSKGGVQELFALATMLPLAGLSEEALKVYNQILDIEPKHPVAATNACFVATLVGVGPEVLLQQRKRWWEANHYTGKVARHNNSKDMDEKCNTCKGETKDCRICGGGGVIKMRPLRVGYVGGDFKRHSAAFIFANVLLHHSPAIEMYLYSSLSVDPAQDPNTKKFMDAVGPRWRDITTMTDEDAAAMIRKDRIDILVDLAGHTNGGRLALFTHKPAPIQVAAWGFAHGTGCPEIDYFFADPVAVPEEERQHYAEKVVDLPCIVTMEAPVEYNLKGTSKPPYHKNDYFTFGAYARYEKMSDECIRAMAEILRRVPDSKLELKDAAYRRPYSIRRIMNLMPDIPNDRLLFSLATDHPTHMLTYQQADLCLDPWPHGGGVVSMEQLWMGCPLLTLYSTQASGRTASSVLTALGRTDWIAKTPEEYVEIAVKLANDPKSIWDARKTLREELLKSPVVVGYAEKVEAAYKAMWKEWCER